MRSSVLINTYQNGRYLAACLDSVLGQTRPADEIIVADNGSTDETAAILARYAGRIRVVDSPRHEGWSPVAHQAGALYDAFRHATGDVIFLLDGDDLFLPAKLETMMAAFAGRPAPVLVQAPPRLIDEHDRALPRRPEPFRHSSDPLAEAYRRHELDLFYPTSTLAFRREFLAAQLPLDYSDGLELACDDRLCLAALGAGRIVTLPDELSCWRRRPESDQGSKSRSPFYLADLSWRRARCFEACRARRELDRISVWRSGRFYLRWLRGVYTFAWQWARR